MIEWIGEHGDGEALLNWKQPTGGSDIIVNGDFDTDSDWTKQAGCTISGGKAVFSNTTNQIFQDVLTIGKMYKVTFTISDYNAGSVRINAGGSTSTARTANGIYIEYLTPSAGTNIAIDGFVAFTGKIDNISVVEWTNATAYNAPTHTANEGFTGNGSITYVNCNWNPSANGVNYTLNDAGFGCYIRNNVTETKAVMGCASSADTKIRLYPRNATDQINANINAANPGIAGSMTDSRGLYVIVRDASNSTIFYRNKAVVDTDTDLSGSLPTESLIVLAYNDNGTPIIHSIFQVSMAFAGGGMLQAGVNNFSDDYNLAMTRLGKNVY